MRGRGKKDAQTGGDREGEFAEMSSILDLWIFNGDIQDLAAWTEAHSTRPKEVIKI